jgi:hypothetical protein
LTTTEPTSETSVLAALDQAARQSQLEAGVEAIRQLCLGFERPVDREIFVRAFERVRDAGWSRHVAAVVQSLLLQPMVQPGAGTLWAKLKYESRDWDATRQVRLLLNAGEAGEAATCAWIDELAAHGERREIVRLATIGELWIASHPPAWGAMAEAFRSTGQHRAGYFWALAWRNQQGLTPSALLSTAELLRANGNDAEAAEASKLALAAETPDASLPVHRCWLAADAALAGEFARAASLLPGVEPSDFDPCRRLLYTLTTAATAVGNAEPARRPQVVVEARESIAAAAAQCPDLRGEPGLRRLYHDVLGRLADSDGATTKVWAWWRRVTS